MAALTTKEKMAESYTMLVMLTDVTTAKAVRAAIHAVVPGTQRKRVEQWQQTLLLGYRAAVRVAKTRAG